MITAPSPEAATNDADQTREVSIDDLIVGRPLVFPVNDTRGRLLLAAGQELTGSAKRRLKSMGVHRVCAHAADSLVQNLEGVELRSTSSLASEDSISARLDQVVEQGLFQVQNSGPAVRERVRKHGATAFDRERQHDVSELRNETQAELACLVKEALQGRNDTGGAVAQMAAQFLAQSTEDTDCVLSVVLEAAKKPDLADHSLKMAVLAMAIGIEMGLDEDNSRRLCVTGLVCDWGMYKLPDELLDADRVLSIGEHLQIQKHSQYTAEILERTTGLPSQTAVIAYQVHERPNGRGYPKQRTSDRINICSRILAVADTYTALTTPRAWRPALTPYAAMETILRMARTRDVDPVATRALLKVLSLFPIGSLVALNDGSIAQVIRRNGERYDRPIVEIVQNSEGRPVPMESRQVVDLSTSELQVTQAIAHPGSLQQTWGEPFVNIERDLR